MLTDARFVEAESTHYTVKLAMYWTCQAICASFQSTPPSYGQIMVCGSCFSSAQHLDTQATHEILKGFPKKEQLTRSQRRP